MDGGDRSGSGLTFEVLELAPVGVAVTRGHDHRLVYTNQAYRSLFGDLPLGVPIRQEFAGPTGKDPFRLFDQVMKSGEPVLVTEVPEDRTVRTPTGQDRFFTYSLSRVAFHDGVHGVLAMVLDVTEQVAAARRIGAIADERIRIMRRYESLVQASAQIVWVSDAEGDVIEPSPQWERVTGQSWEEFRGDGWLQVVHPDDREPTLESWSRALEQVPDVWENVYRLRTVDDGYRHFQTRAVPILEEGRVVEWVAMCTDIEEQRDRQRRQRLLARANDAMVTGMSLEQTLGALAEVIVPELADGCGVHLIVDLAEGPAGAVPLTVERVAAVVGPGLPPLQRLKRQRVKREGSFAQAVREARPILRTFPPGSPPDDLGPSSTQAWLRESRANSTLVLPVTIDGTVTAVVTASTCGERPPIEQSDIDLLQQTFENAHDALHNLVRYQRARQVAVAMQHSLLAEPPRVPGLEIAVRYRPSLSAADVGGDWYDSFVLPDGATVLAIGDVAGHDLRAAVTMGQLRNMLRSLLVDRQGPPGEILTRLNFAVETLHREETATCVLARVEHHDDGHELHYAVAGHPPPLLVTHDSEGRFLESAANPLLGVPHPQTLDSAREPLPPLSTLLLYTDGLVERPGEDLGDGLARLCDHATAQARAPLDHFCDELLSRMPISEADDNAMIAMRLTGTP